MPKTPITLAGNLPADDEHNGVVSIKEDLVRDPGQIRYAVIAFDAMKTVKVTDTGEQTPIMRVRWVEVATEDNAVAVEKMLAAIAQDRLGTLPVEPTAGDGDSAE